VVNVLLVASVIFSYMLIFGLKRSVFQWWWALAKGICTQIPSLVTRLRSVLTLTLFCSFNCDSHVRLEKLLALVDRHQHQPDVALDLRRLLEGMRIARLRGVGSDFGVCASSSMYFHQTLPIILISNA
jgi:hypothetical protein